MKKLAKFFATILTVIMVLAPTTQAFAVTTAQTQTKNITPITTKDPKTGETIKITPINVTPITIKDPKTGVETEKITIPMTIIDPKTGVAKSNASMAASEESWTDITVSNSSICWNIHEPGADDFAGSLHISCISHGDFGSSWPIHGLTGSEPAYLVKGWTYEVVLTGYSTPDMGYIVGAGRFTY